MLFWTLNEKLNFKSLLPVFDYPIATDCLPFFIHVENFISAVHFSVISLNIFLHKYILTL
jgi:hypothetical protein